MKLLFLDLGAGGSYFGQVRAILACDAPGVPATELMSNAPVFNSKASTYLLAVLAALLAKGEGLPGELLNVATFNGDDLLNDLAEVVCIDHFGNAMIGLQAFILVEANRLEVGGKVIGRARTFSSLQKGTAFWFGNANGLAELVVNGECADKMHELDIGSTMRVV